MFVCDAVALTSVEKLNAVERKSAPGRAAAVTPLPVVVVSSSHVPLLFEGVKRHNDALVDVAHDPV